MGVTLPVPDFEALRDARVTLGAGSMLPDEQETCEQREALRVNIQGPRALGARGDSQLLQQCALAWKTQEAIRERREGGDYCGCHSGRSPAAETRRPKRTCAWRQQSRGQFQRTLCL